MPIDITDTFQPSGGPGAFDLYQPEDIQAGDVDVTLTLISGGKVVCSGTDGEITFQTGSGAPSHSANEGTAYWDTSGNALYINSSGSTTWESISGGGLSNAFATIDAETGTNPAASGDDTLIVSGGSGITTSGDSGTNTLTITTVDGEIDHDSLLNFAANEHFTEASIDHTAIQNIGTNSHSQIDTHIAASSSVHGVTGDVVGTTDSQTLSNKTLGTDLACGGFDLSNVTQVTLGSTILTSAKLECSSGTFELKNGLSNTSDLSITTENASASVILGSGDGDIECSGDSLVNVVIQDTKMVEVHDPTDSENIRIMLVTDLLDIEELFGVTDQGTATIQLKSRPWTDPFTGTAANASGTLVCDDESGNGNSTATGFTQVDGSSTPRVLVLTTSATTGTPTMLWVGIKYRMERN